VFDKFLSDERHKGWLKCVESEGKETHITPSFFNKRKRGREKCIFLHQFTYVCNKFENNETRSLPTKQQLKLCKIHVCVHNPMKHTSHIHYIQAD